MKLIKTSISDVVLLEPQVHYDDRGWFVESFNENVFRQLLANHGLPAPKAFVQDNHSCSRKGVLRGLHYQLPPKAQGKLVRVVKGRAFDVAVDIRVESPTYGKAVTVELSESNRLMLWIPEGFAHGFLALEEDTHFLYKTTDYYSKTSEAAVKWDDPTLNIPWPTDVEFIIGAKDSGAPYFAAARGGEF